MMRRARSLIAGVVIVAAIAVAAPMTCNSVNADKVKIVVPKGANLRVAAESLQANHVIRFPTLFRLYGKVKGHDRSIRAGTYVLQPRMSWGELLDVLRGGKSLEVSITIPEGWSLNQIVPQLARVLGVPQDSVNAAVRDTTLLRRLDIPTATLEGYLFPDTYVFPDGTTARAAVRLMVARFEQVWQPEWNDILQQRALNRNDVMALAAIVEKEARLPEERPVIAAVYLNRLRVGMRLQADPTVQYAIGRHVTRVFYKDLEIDSPYNTYKYAGLPPGPIASPGKPSIVAALKPADVKYVFFVAFPDGHHEFTNSLEQHNAAKRRARREWDALAARQRDTMRPTPAASAPPR